ncbi:hypothetical protein EDD98_1935 [Streptomyces sp. PanSC19]|uniref:hypothetical protein n=1 Tax=Streptomyces sp. PanSC19 TaxID=1520455 RepID=UPI000F47879B|nr:hypothetical protein [Streptomyces sp. PanSC19]ROQ32936.1 hypothetical protein EDD98_1935 [Streptomyces sp. PanSC19]
MNPTVRTTALSRGALGVGALTAVLSLLLVVGGLTADTGAGETGQPAGVLGLVGLFLGGTLLAVGALARKVVALGTHR